MVRTFLFFLIASFLESTLSAQVRWEHISSKNGAIEIPNKGKQQTSAAVADFDNDGINDFCISERTSAPGLVWYKRTSDGWKRYMVDAACTFSRSAAGQLVNGGRPEIVLVVGDGLAPMYMYEFQKDTWVRKEIVPKVSNGHSLSIIDFDGDGNMDIWYAEMTLGGHTEAANRILFGDGTGNFDHDMIISKGIDLHDSEIADLDGDGDLDILGKPYDGDAPRLDIWLQNGTGKKP